LLHILEYVNDKNPTTDNFIVDMSFEPIKQQLKRDLVKYEERAVRSRNNGKLGGRPKKEEKPKKPSGLNDNPDEPRKPDTVNVTGTVKGNVKDKVIVSKDNIDSRKLKFANSLKVYIDKFGRETVKEFYEYWTENNKSNTKFKMELQKTWDSEKRLSRWSQNDFNNKNTKNGKGQTNFDAVKEWGQDFLDSQDKSV